MDNQRPTQLTQQIQQAIVDHGGVLPFAQFMERALYTPGLGYYTHPDAVIFGPEGDFTTAPERSPLFSYCIAEQCAQVLAQDQRGCILEIGAGSGTMAAHILQHLADRHQLPKHYYIYERSHALRTRQQRALQDNCPDIFPRVIWLDTLEALQMNGIILANEVLDALPVERFQATATGLCALGVAWQHDQFHLAPMPELKLPLAHLETLALPCPYQSEINTQLNRWLAPLRQTLKDGVVLLLDYGDPQADYYHPQRTQGTLRCHYRHHVHNDPLLHVGEQDITASVDFTAVAYAAYDLGFQIAHYTQQTHFLLNCGLTTWLEPPKNSQLTPAQQADRLAQSKWLTHPNEMGERFKVMALTTPTWDLPLQGFVSGEQQHRL